MATASLKTLSAYPINKLLDRAAKHGITFDPGSEVTKLEVVTSIFNFENGIVPEPEKKKDNRAGRKKGLVSDMKAVRGIIRRLLDQAIDAPDTAFNAQLTSKGQVPFTVWVSVSYIDKVPKFILGPKEGVITHNLDTQGGCYRVLAQTLGFEENAIPTAELAEDDE